MQGGRLAANLITLSRRMRLRSTTRPVLSRPAKLQLGEGAGLVLPSCTTEGMSLQLKEIARLVAPDAHAVVLLDQAGWHQSKRLMIPDNITLMPLPAKAPELNAAE